MKKVLAFIILIAVGVFFLLNQKGDSENELLEDVKPVTSVGNASDSQAEVKKKEKKPQPKTATEEKKEVAQEPPKTAEEGLARVHEKVAKLYAKKNGEEELIEFFKENGLSPKVSRDSNPYTGSMTMIRTEKGFEGSRYYHAQFFTDETGNSYLQHLSTEFRPGPQAFETVQALMEKTYGVSDGKLSRDGNFIQYALNDNGVERVLWIKKMDQSDFDNALFNAYDPKTDMGTIRVAIELEIHDSEREDADHLHPEN